mmetsp:Transcript_16353/g.29742  ORF Transcript_16353/g.29742 Transcript_16353/m.29742 type:complete len:378 (-) Transcript_16353:74-1207(-)
MNGRNRALLRLCVAAVVFWSSSPRAAVPPVSTLATNTMQAIANGLTLANAAEVANSALLKMKVLPKYASHADLTARGEQLADLLLFDSRLKGRIISNLGSKAGAPDQVVAVNGTVLEEAVAQAAKSDKRGLNVLWAEPGSGKTMSAYRVALQERQVDQCLILLVGPFDRTLRDFIRSDTIAPEYIFNTMLDRLNAMGRAAVIILDNSFDEELRSVDKGILMNILRLCHTQGHRILVLCQSAATASTLSSINGNRARESSAQTKLQSGTARWNQATDFLMKRRFQALATEARAEAEKRAAPTSVFGKCIRGLRRFVSQWIPWLKKFDISKLNETTIEELWSQVASELPASIVKQVLANAEIQDRHKGWTPTGLEQEVF